MLEGFEGGAGIVEGDREGRVVSDRGDEGGEHVAHGEVEVLPVEQGGGCPVPEVEVGVAVVVGVGGAAGADEVEGVVAGVAGAAGFCSDRLVGFTRPPILPLSPITCCSVVRPNPGFPNRLPICVRGAPK